MKAFVALTDGDWFQALRTRPDLEEVNFFFAGRVPFRALKRGELFVFKLHSPHDAVVGGGFFQHYTRLPHSIAWDYFGEKNGVPSLSRMRRRIERSRSIEAEPGADYEIGCVLLSTPFFLADEEWIPVPEDFARTVGRGKRYDLGRGAGARLWREIQFRIHGQLLAEPANSQLSLYGETILIRTRIGEGTFRTLIADVYHRRCCVTGESALPVLEATHIKPIHSGGRHALNNGVLLRADIRRLYDGGWVTITPEYRFKTSGRLQLEFDGGQPYRPLDGQEIQLPVRAEERPRPEFLDWHLKTVFRG